MKLKDFLKVLPEFEPVQLLVVDKSKHQIVYDETHFKERIPAYLLDKRIRYVSVDDYNCTLTCSLNN